VKPSTWDALGNVYVVSPRLQGATPERVVELVGDADGLVEVTPLAADAAEVVIWNADGSRAEMSGNATRIAAAWLAKRTGAAVVRIVSGDREVSVRFLADGTAEQDMGEIRIGPPEELEGIEFVRVEVGNPHAVVRGDPADVVWIGPRLETHPAFPNRTNVQVGRIDGSRTVTARVWERGVGETSSSGTGAVAVAAGCIGAGEVEVRFPGGTLAVRLVGSRAFLTGPAVQLS